MMSSMLAQKNISRAYASVSLYFPPFRPVYVYTSGPASEFIRVRKYFGELLNCFFFSLGPFFFCVFGFAADFEAQEQDMEHRWTFQGTGYNYWILGWSHLGGLAQNIKVRN
ncbi:hypothetical protein F4703DRAFT_1918670 [Phycomyces blakesleeanus]